MRGERAAARAESPSRMATSGAPAGGAVVSAAVAAGPGVEVAAGGAVWVRVVVVDAGFAHFPLLRRAIAASTAGRKSGNALSNAGSMVLSVRRRSFSECRQAS